jgi:hypothetical protein
MVNTQDDYGFLRLINECLIYATQAEAYAPMVIAKVLDGLEVVIERHRPALKRSGWMDNPRTYEKATAFLETWNNWGTWNASVLALAIQYGIRKYSIDSIKKRLKTCNPSEGRPMLDFALRRVTDTVLEPRAPDVGVVEALLKRGADPNAEFEGKIIWVRYVDYVRRYVSQPNAVWAETAALLVRHGACRWAVRVGRTATEKALLKGQRKSISHATANQVDMATGMESAFGTEQGQALAELLRTGTSRGLSVWRNLGRVISPKR